MQTQVRWTGGEIARLRRRLKEKREEYAGGGEMRAIAEVAGDFGITSAQVREVIARADRKDQAKRATYARGASPKPVVDMYGHERGAIIQRLETGLHPHMAWRDPREAPAGMSFRPDNTPLAHTLAGACVWLRKNTIGAHDCSSDLLWCIVMQEHCDAEAQRVVTALKHAWIDMHEPVAKLAVTMPGLAAVEETAQILVSQCVTGIRTRRKIPVHWQLWRKMQQSGEHMLWSLADRASRRAVAALR